MKRADILAVLQDGPRTAAQIGAALNQLPRNVSRTCSTLISLGVIKRVDGGAGRGSFAVYALDTYAGTYEAKPRNSFHFETSGPKHPGVTVRRDPCFYCGTRGDVPCRHNRGDDAWEYHGSGERKAA